MHFPGSILSNSFDLAIVGAGPVGLSIAHALKDCGLRLIVIEAGGEKRNLKNELDTFGADTVSPSSHYPAHMFRREILGGASSVWGGRCIPFEESDFRATPLRDGWPLKFDQIRPWLVRAVAFLEAGAYEYTEADAFETPIMLSKENAGLSLDGIERFSRPTNVWKRYRGELERAGNVTISSHTTVLEVMVSADARRVTGVRVATPDGERTRIHARCVVVAAGGIETARLLLASRSARSAGLGNENDLVGRFYMTHLIGDIGVWKLPEWFDQAKIGYRMTKDGIYGRMVMQLAQSVRAARNLPNVIFRPNIPAVWNPGHHDPVLSAMYLAKRMIAPEYGHRMNTQGRGRDRKDATPASLGPHLVNLARSPTALASFAWQWSRLRIMADRKMPSVFMTRADRAYPVELNAEQYPDPQSRITLSDSHDRFGRPRIHLKWRTDEKTIEGLHTTLDLLRRAIAAAGLGTFDFDPAAVETHIAPQGGHHIGTVRMADEASRGVVDANGELFHTRALFVAGSALFPTSGAANPTLLAVAIALRQSAYLKQRLTATLPVRLSSTDP